RGARGGLVESRKQETPDVGQKILGPLHVVGVAEGEDAFLPARGGQEPLEHRRGVRVGKGGREDAQGEGIDELEGTGAQTVVYADQLHAAGIAGADGRGVPLLLPATDRAAKTNHLLWHGITPALVAPLSRPGRVRSGVREILAPGLHVHSGG